MNCRRGSFVRKKVEAILEALCERLVERDEPVTLALLSAIAGESIFLLGVPGVGKSLVARRLKFAFRDGVSFEYLMSKYSTPDEIFGPISIKKLKEEDKYERLTDRYLPGANVVFLDEIWKSGPAIQNALLTVLNEKIYRNGEQDIYVNLRGIITASNELPPKGSGLEPLWDRFLLRYHMQGIQEPKNFLKMIVATEDVYEDTLLDENKLTHDELAQWDESIDAVGVPPEVLNTIQVVRQKVSEHNERAGNHPEIRIYDRRWKKIVRLLRTSAFLNGREQVDLMDCFLMIHCLWNEPSQVEVVQEIVAETIRKHGYSMAVQLGMLRREIEALHREVEDEIRIKRTKTVDQLAVVHDGYVELTAQDRPFEGIYLKLEDLRKMPLKEWSVASVYGTDLKPSNRLKARRGSEEFAVEFEYNAEHLVLGLKTQKVERTETIVRRPHPLLTSHWDKQAQQLSSYLEEQLSRVDSESPSELNSIEENLFVSGSLAKIVRSNLEEVKRALVQLKLRLEKVQHVYTHFE